MLSAGVVITAFTVAAVLDLQILSNTTLSVGSVLAVRNASTVYVAGGAGGGTLFALGVSADGKKVQQVGTAGVCGGRATGVHALQLDPELSVVYVSCPGSIDSVAVPEDSTPSNRASFTQREREWTPALALGRSVLYAGSHNPLGKSPYLEVLTLKDPFNLAVASNFSGGAIGALAYMPKRGGLVALGGTRLELYTADSLGALKPSGKVPSLQGMFTGNAVAVVESDSGSFAYVAGAGLCLGVVNITDFTAPQEIPFASEGNNGLVVVPATINNCPMLYAACDRKLHLFNLSSPSSPSHTGSVEFPVFIDDVAAYGTRSFVTSGSDFYVVDSL